MANAADTPRDDSTQASGPFGRLFASRFWREWRGFIIFVIVMLIFRSIIADWNQVPSGSMKPSIIEGDRVMVNKLAYDLRIPFTLVRLAWFDEPQRGDVVTFPSPVDERLFIKRIIAVPGDLVELRRNVLIINGERATYVELTAEQIAELDVDEKYKFRFFRESLLGSERLIMLAREPRDVRYTSWGPERLGEGEYLMLGDNRDFSGDSRKIGLVERERILGRAHGIAFSWDYMQFAAPRWDRFFEDLP